MQFHIYLTPNAKTNSIQADGEDMFGNIVYKCRIAAAPRDGEANTALIQYLSKLLSIPKKDLHIIRWFKSRHKVIQIEREDLEIPF